MNIVNDDKGYITSILIVIIIIPIILLLISTINQSNEIVGNSTEKSESNRLSSITSDFQNDVESIVKKSLSNLTITVINTKEPVNNASSELKDMVQEELNYTQSEYYNNTGCIISCNITNIEPSSDPFNISIDYNISTELDNKEINKVIHEDINVIDNHTLIYDPLPVLVNDSMSSESKEFYGSFLFSLVNDSNRINSRTIKKCPYEDYTEHGHNSTVMSNCLDNGYYHESHDGLCILCRLENRTSCPHMGLETFVLPTVMTTEAPVSVDHVLLNTTKNGVYKGNLLMVNNSAFLYLDGGHTSKYGL